MGFLINGLNICIKIRILLKGIMTNTKKLVAPYNRASNLKLKIRAGVNVNLKRENPSVSRAENPSISRAENHVKDLKDLKEDKLFII